LSGDFHLSRRRRRTKISFAMAAARASSIRCCRPPHNRGRCRPLCPVVPDVHARRLAPPVQPFKDLDLLGARRRGLDSGGIGHRSDAQRLGRFGWNGLAQRDGQILRQPHAARFILNWGTAENWEERGFLRASKNARSPIKRLTLSPWAVRASQGGSESLFRSYGDQPCPWTVLCLHVLLFSLRPRPDPMAPPTPSS